MADLPPLPQPRPNIPGEPPFLDYAAVSQPEMRFVTDGRALRHLSARWLALLAAVVIALFLCWLMLQPFLNVLLWATVLTIIFYPLQVHLARRLRRPAWAAALCCLVVVGVVVIPLGLITWAVVNEARGAAEYLHKHWDQLLSPENRIVGFLESYVVDLHNPDIKELVGRFQDLSGPVALQTFGIVGTVLWVVLQLVFIVITMFYLFRDGERILIAMVESLPLERAQSQRIFDRTREVISASVFGVLVIATVQAVLGEIGFLVVRLPSPLLWGVVMFFFSMIPMAGSFFVWVPACLYLLAQGQWIKALVLAAWCAGVVGMVDNLFRPRLVGKRTRLHELLIFFSVLGGLKVFGALGLVMGPVVVAITLALLDVFRKADRPAPPSEPTLAERQAALRNVPPDDEDDLGDGNRGGTFREIAGP